MESDFLAGDDQLLVKAATLGGADGRARWNAWRERHQIGDAHGAAHQLLPMIFWTQRPWPVDDPDAGLLKGTVRFTWSRNRLEVDFLVGVLETLQRRSIRAAIVDGAALALKHYPHLGLRRIERLRLLVDPRDAAGAVEGLGAVGLRASRRPRADRLGPRRLELSDDHDRRLELERTNGHRTGGSPASALGKVWRVPDDRGIDSLSLDPTAQLLRLLSEIERAVGPARIQPLVDAHVLLQSASDLVDWQQVLDTIELSVSLCHAPEALTYLQRALNARVPAQALARLAKLQPGSRAPWTVRAASSARRLILGRLLRSITARLRGRRELLHGSPHMRPN